MSREMKRIPPISSKAAVWLGGGHEILPTHGHQPVISLCRASNSIGSLLSAHFIRPRNAFTST